MIVWREKAKAFAIHFLFTLLAAGVAAAFVFLVWFPHPFQRMLGGTRLFEIMILCVLGLGPLATFILYRSSKTRRALLVDYVLIAVLQLGAFAYGLYSISNSRPAFIVSVGDRIEVISAGEIDDADLAQGAEGYRHRPVTGPRLVGIEEPQDPREREKVMFLALAGKDYPMLPAYYVPYERTLPQIKERSLPLDELELRHPQARPLIANAIAELQISADRLVWLPAKHQNGFWTAVLDRDSGRPLYWLPLDPY